jgi:hypothetical protein
MILFLDYYEHQGGNVVGFSLTQWINEYDNEFNRCESLYTASAITASI